jgi:hypothetical protein
MQLKGNRKVAGLIILGGNPSLKSVVGALHKAVLPSRAGCETQSLISCLKKESPDSLYKARDSHPIPRNHRPLYCQTRHNLYKLLLVRLK